MSRRFLGGFPIAGSAYYGTSPIVDTEIDYAGAFVMDSAIDGLLDVIRRLPAHRRIHPPTWQDKNMFTPGHII